MAAQRKVCSQLMLLVGSNPLPNYLATLILQAQSIHLFYSPQTAPIKEQLVEMLKERLGSPDVIETCIEDATDAAKVRAAFSSLPEDAHLHYTGGTKIMAAHARMAFGTLGGSDRQASYLDERKGIFRFDDGYEIELSQEGLELSLEDVLMLHGIERIAGKVSPGPASTEQDVETLVKVVLNQPDRARELYELHHVEGKRYGFTEAKKTPVVIGKVVDGALSISQLPEEGWTARTYEKWCDFLGGGWLEMWCGDLVKSLVSGAEVSRGTDCKLDNGRQFEIDLALVRGHRLYVISCSTDTKIGLCKSKLFEVAMRARQLGGDLARSALVCLLHGKDPKGPFVDQLRNDVADIWDAPNTPRVFGLDDLKEWAGIQGKPNPSSLKHWLNS